MFAIRLKTLREDAGMSQAQLAMKLGVRQSTVGMWENGKNKPQNSKLEQLASIFGVSTDYLLGRTDDMNDDQIDSVTGREPARTTEHTSEGIKILGAVDKMPAADRQRALDVMKVVFAQYAEFF